MHFHCCRSCLFRPLSQISIYILSAVAWKNFNCTRAIYQLSAINICPAVFLPFKCSDKYISEIFLLNTQIITSLTYIVSKFFLLLWDLYGLFHANSHRQRIIRSSSDNLIYYTLPCFNFFAIANCCLSLHTEIVS